MTRVLHFSDIHLPLLPPALPLGSWLGKRALAALNYIVRRRQYFRSGHAKVEALRDLIARSEVDVVIFSGDSVNFGSEPELTHASATLAPLFELGHRFVTVPGNHDLYLSDTVTRGWYTRHFGATQEGDCPDLAGEHGWPFVRLYDHLAIVAVNSARPNRSIFVSSGEVSEDQLAALPNLLRDDRLASRFVLVVTHYSLRLPSGKPDTPSHGLVNCDAFLDALAGVDNLAVASGHIHHGFCVGPPHLPIHNFCAGSATFRDRESAWLYDIDQLGLSAQLLRWRHGFEPSSDSITVARRPE